MKAGGVSSPTPPTRPSATTRDVPGAGDQRPRAARRAGGIQAEVAQEYYAGVVWDGIRKQP